MIHSIEVDVAPYYHSPTGDHNDPEVQQLVKTYLKKRLEKEYPGVPIRTEFNIHTDIYGDTEAEEKDVEAFLTASVSDFVAQRAAAIDLDDPDGPDRPSYEEVAEIDECYEYVVWNLLGRFRKVLCENCQQLAGSDLDLLEVNEENIAYITAKLPHFRFAIRSLNKALVPFGLIVSFTKLTPNSSVSALPPDPDGPPYPLDYQLDDPKACFPFTAWNLIGRIMEQTCDETRKADGVPLESYWEPEMVMEVMEGLPCGKEVLKIVLRRLRGLGEHFR